MSEALMQVILIYLFYLGISFGIIKLTNFLIKRKMPMKILLFLALILPLVIYVPVEVKTFQYGKDFDALLMKTDINSRAIIYYKVISISQDQAKLFVVEGENGEHQLGSYYYFTKENQQWIISETVDTLWTNLGGSATEFGFPPYF